MQDQVSTRRLRRIPHSYMRPDVQGGSDRSAVAAAGPIRVFATSLWFGLGCGLLETAIQFGRVRFYDPTSLGLLQMNQHAVWMITASTTLVFAGIGLVFGLLAAVVKRPWLRRTSNLTLACLAAYSLVLIYRNLAPIAYLSMAGGLGTCMARFLANREAGFRRVVVYSLPALGLMALGLGAADFVWGSVAERQAISNLPPARPGAPNVLWIVLDTVRADHTSLHGHSRDTTPNLARMAERGVLFDEARSPATWTLPSHVSMFTGRWPFQLYNLPDQAKGYPPRRLADSHTTVAESLLNHGYATAGFVANTYFCNNWYNLGQGFLRYEDSPIDLPSIMRSSNLGRTVDSFFGTAHNERDDSRVSRKDAATVNGEVLDWLGSSSREDRPFFVFLNYFDAHDPYLLDEEPDDCLGLDKATDEDRRLLKDWHETDKKDLHPEQLRLSLDCYDDCISYLDDQLGLLFDEMERRGQMENTLVIVTSDHGEFFGEHGHFLHGTALYRPATHVPLLIVPPRGRDRSAPERVSAPVSLRNLPATILDLVGIPQAQSPFPGRSLALSWKGKGSRGEDLVFSETGGQPDPSGRTHIPCSVVFEGKSYIRNGNGREELYDLKADPGENHNLAGKPENAAILTKIRDILGRQEGKAEMTVVDR